MQGFRVTVTIFIEEFAAVQRYELQLWGLIPTTYVSVLRREATVDPRSAAVASIIRVLGSRTVEAVLPPGLSFPDESRRDSGRRSWRHSHTHRRPSTSWRCELPPRARGPRP